MRVLSKSLYRFFLGLMFSCSIITPYSSHALTSKTTNVINGSAPYLTFDDGRTPVINADGLLEISLSNGDKYTPATNTSSQTNPIVLPNFGQSFADIGMVIPADSDSIELNSLISAPYNYWRDDDGDGQGLNGITATGSLSLSIVDKNNQVISRNTVPTICNAPYRVKLTSTEGKLETSYGVPKSIDFVASNVTYYINPKPTPSICFARPNLEKGTGPNAGLPNENEWSPNNGFFIQSSYNKNFPTTGANSLYFDLIIAGNDQALTWENVSHDGITATMNNSTKNSVRVTLTGPSATYSQIRDPEPGVIIKKPSLPKVFELIGRDSNNREVVKYGFNLQRWFVYRGDKKRSAEDDQLMSDLADEDNNPNPVPGVAFALAQKSWCEKVGYKLSDITDLTNAYCSDTIGSTNDGSCRAQSGIKPLSLGNNYHRKIGGGLLAEWGVISKYDESIDPSAGYWTGRTVEYNNITYGFLVGHQGGGIYGYAPNIFLRTAFCVTDHAPIL